MKRLLFLLLVSLFAACNPTSPGRWYAIVPSGDQSQGYPYYAREYKKENGCITYYGYSSMNDDYGYGTMTVCGSFTIETYYIK